MAGVFFVGFVSVAQGLMKHAAFVYSLGLIVMMFRTILLTWRSLLEAARVRKEVINCNPLIAVESHGRYTCVS